MTKKAIQRLMAVAVMVILIGAGSAWANIYDHFDDGVLDAAWDVIFENSTGWTYSESGTHLTVTDIGDIGAVVYISQDFYASENFEAECSFSWDSAGTKTAMQAFTIELFSDEIRVATVGFYDPWLYHRGAKIASIGDNQHHTGTNSLPLSGSATVRIQRIAGTVTVYWDGNILLTGSNTGIVDKLRIRLARTNYPGAVFGSFSTDYISASPATLSKLEITGPNEVAENSPTQYKAVAHYDNNSTADVTASVDWSVEPNDIADVNAGLLTTEMIDLPMDATITAKYSEGDVNESDEKDVSIFAICPSGSALEFDGVDDYVEFGDNFNNVNAPFSIAAWVNINQPGIYGVFTSDNATSGNYYGFWLGVGHDYIAVGYGDGTGRNPSDRRSKKSNLSIPLNTWVFVAAVVRGPTDMDIYKNGLNVGGAYTGSGGNMVHNTYKAVIGDFSAWQHIYFNGIIDDVRIYNKALSSDEIQESMHTRPDTNEPNLVAYWNFDKGSGPVAFDSSGNGNHGDLGDPTCDPRDPECPSRPMWVEPGAPTDICTMEGLFERNINQAINLKLDMLDILEEALGKEMAGQYILEQFLNDSDSNVWKKRDILESKRMVRSAIQNEEKAETNVNQSIDKLDDALDSLGIE